MRTNPAGCFCRILQFQQQADSDRKLAKIVGRFTPTNRDPNSPEMGPTKTQRTQVDSDASDRIAELDWGRVI